MDSLTHVVLGAGIQSAMLGRSQGRKALLYGAALCTLPDLDVFLPHADPVSLMTNHRTFSHSVWVLTAVACLLAWLIRKRWPEAPYSGRRLFLTLWLVLMSHPFMDALTSYGTQVFWPLPNPPVSISSLFIIDPVFTLPLLLAFVACLIWGEGAARLRSFALAFCAVYVAWTLAAKTYTEHRVLEALRQQGTPPVAVFSVPMPLNTLLWRVVARMPDDTYVDAVAGVLDTAPPEMVREPLNQAGVQLPNAPLLERLVWFTRDWLRYDVVGRNLVVSDLRMGMPGHYSFRFVMGRADDTGAWVPVRPERWPSERGGWTELQQILRRIVSQSPPLPLAQWAAKTDTASVPATRAAQ